MAEKRDSYQLANQGGAQSAVQEVPSQQSVDLLIRLLQEFERRSSSTGTALPPDVERDIAAVSAAFASIESALALGESPIIIYQRDTRQGSHGRGHEGDHRRLAVCSRVRPSVLALPPRRTSRSSV